MGRPFKVMVLGSLAAMTAASTQGATADRGAQVVLRGHVTATGAIRIRQADGWHVRYGGPMPGQSLRHGAAIAIGFATRDRQGTGDVQQDYSGQTATDGIYDITVTAPGEADSTALAYDAVNDTYQLAGDAAADPGLAYDAATGQPLQCPPDCTNAASGSETASAGNTGVADSVGSTGSVALVGGSFTLDSPEIDDSFAATAADDSDRLALALVERAGAASQDPADGDSGRAVSTEVPAPGMLLLFAMACAVLPLRRRASRGA